MVARQVKSALPTRGTGVRDFHPKKVSLQIEDEDEFTEGTVDETEDLSGRSGQNFSGMKFPLNGGRRNSKSITKVDPEATKYISFQKKAWKALPVPNQAAVKSSQSVRTANSITRKRSKSLRFGQVHFRNFDQTLGDHPSTSYGPPISLDWHYEDGKSVRVDAYEQERQANRRTMRQLMLNYYQRKNILMWQYGYSEAELKKATKQAGRTALQRSVTKYFLPVSKVEEAFQSAGRKAKRVVGGNKKETAKAAMPAMPEPKKATPQAPIPARPARISSIKKVAAPQQSVTPSPVIPRPVMTTSRRPAPSVAIIKSASSEDGLAC